MAKWRYIHVEEVEKWRWRNGDEEMEMGARKKWKPVRRRNGKPHRQEMKIIVYPVCGTAALSWSWNTAMAFATA